MSEKWLVCGGRNFGDMTQRNKLSEDNQIKLIKEYRFILDSLTKLSIERDKRDLDKQENWLPDVFIISGKARGVDSAAIDWAVCNWCQFKEYPADWDKYGRSAGYIRNKQMLEEGKPDLVIAFPGGRGTENMKKLAREAGVEVIEFNYVS